MGRSLALVLALVEDDSSGRWTGSREVVGGSELRFLVRLAGGAAAARDGLPEAASGEDPGSVEEDATGREGDDEAPALCGQIRLCLLRLDATPKRRLHISQVCAAQGV